tara:strand:+ start:220 stop:603 length:384 start_codon:yes stop_codon:yes gene_type:complete
MAATKKGDIIMKVEKLIGVLAALNDTGKVASDMYTLHKTKYYSQSRDTFTPISEMNIIHLIRAFKKIVDEVADLREDLDDSKMKISELCKEGDKLEKIIEHNDKVYKKNLQQQDEWQKMYNNNKEKV